MNGNQLPEVLARQITGVTVSEVDEPTALEAVAELIAEQGGVTQAAQAAGVDRRTIQRWRAGTQRPRNSTVEQVRERLAEQREAIYSGSLDRVKLSFVYDGRSRVVDDASLRIDRTTLDDVVKAWAIGDREGMAEAFIQGIGDLFYADIIAAAYEGKEDGYMSPKGFYG